MTKLATISLPYGPRGAPAVAGSDGKANRTGGRRSLIQRIFACGILFACLAIGGAAIIVTTLRARTLADTERELRNMALVLAEQSARSFEALTLVESGLVQRIEKLGVTSATDLRERLSGYDAHVMLRDTINGLPHVESVALFDSAGNLVNFTRQWPVPRFNITDRDYFRTFIADRQITIMLSEPVLNRTTGTWSIYLTRKFSAPNGELIGLISGAVERRYLEQFFNRIKLDPGSTISLFRRDGVLLASYPPQRIGERGPLPSREMNALLAMPQQNIAWMSDAEGEERIVAVQEVANYPLRIAISTTTSAALDDWRREAILLMGAAGLIVLIIAGATFVIVHQFRDYTELARDRANDAVDRKAAELVLRETERVHKQLNKQKLQLDTVLDNILQGIVLLDADASMLVCNRRYLEIYGLSPEVVKPGCTLKEMIQHRLETGSFKGNVDKTVEKILAGMAERRPSTTTAHLSGGRTISIFMQPMTEGGWVVTHQDVTEQQRVEQEAERMQRFLLTVIEHVPSIVIVKDARDLRYVLINQAAEQFYGLPRSKVIGRTARDLFPLDSADAIAAQDRMLLRAGSDMIAGTQMIETPSNGFRHVWARRLAIRDSHGAPQFLLSVIEDQTRSQKAA